MDNITIETTKKSENEIEVTKTVVVEPQVSTQVYSYEFLVSQKETIQAQKDRDSAQRDIEIAEVDKLLAECAKLDVKEKVVAPTPALQEEPIIP